MLNKTKSEHYNFTRKRPSIVSVDQQATTSSNSKHSLTVVDSGNERECSLTHMLLVYAQQEDDVSVGQILNNVLNVLELHFHSYADEKRQIYFEGIFQILHNFGEQITEFALIETMQLLQLDPLAPLTFETFLLVLCHLPRIKQDHHIFFDVFHELDQNQDAYITFEDVQMSLPRLISHLDEELVRAAIRIMDTDHDNNRLSYFDFVTSLIALQECQIETNVDGMMINEEKEKERTHVE